ncbi:xylulokinase [Verminephrobacter eiseniae]|uniref:xylulokinase n=1 Tax=Verminephrobacter eiseniae TaxID=364317 RepID=UPI0022382A0D|nr:xylulokinase [Verminephrobacter eiseniae]MCW5231532.1 xylulokinase [Verminephrobacter eiseniae]MCW5293261.1 xylulokinase [Verminephrobacter eiseniae]MCW8187124.1 xylulokinase [Verminephrobacter eiseniae]MCW8225569.1 xylulokinase [Verminephrobacter eiseniae]MCW8235090.1 xylulokinase [Verminephrobacter eiseniae]
MYLGIDLGTSGVKLLLLDEQQQVLATADAAVPQHRPQPTWSEQHPADWMAAVESAVAQLRAQAPAAWRQLRGIGLSGQMHGAVVLDAQGQVLRPAILWNDGRASAECAALEQIEPAARQITGNLAMPGFTAPKLLWLRTHEPAVFAQIRRVLLPKDWLRLQLTGDAVSDLSDASGTLWLDVGARAWSQAMLQACGLNLSHMPALAEGSAPTGVLRADIARRWGLATGVPAGMQKGVVLAAGAGDNAASAVGVGARIAGQGLVSLGTSGVVFRVTDAFAPATGRAVHAFAHALPQRWHQMSVMLSAASAFGWVTRLTGQRDEARLSAAVAAMAQARQAQAPLFLPYLSGERTPHNDAAASGVFMGLRAEHEATDLAYAVMEGVCFGLMDGLNAMRLTDTGGAPATGHAAQAGNAVHASRAGAAPAMALALVGGGARSNPWAQLLASGLGCALQRPQGAHAAAALGAARLAAMACGGDEAQWCQSLPADASFVPQAAQQALLAERYARFVALYPALQSQFGKYPVNTA